MKGSRLKSAKKRQSKKIFDIEIIKAFGRINTLREINETYEIPGDSKDYIKRIQEKKKKKTK